ncbi:hypothetical protein EVAR_20288_1 [Eumeta japonica]|uniref:Uncharacterized protein n=1 Tax=Eumeta variegata TaxID=151549 RepID=A0A4C1VM43_EUMVA|nr:hypothetical protein EVAR_20288_1 [Eumeta japonica]
MTPPYYDLKRSSNRSAPALPAHRLEIQPERNLHVISYAEMPTLRHPWGNHAPTASHDDRLRQTKSSNLQFIGATDNSQPICCSRVFWSVKVGHAPRTRVRGSSLAVDCGCTIALNAAIPLSGSLKKRPKGGERLPSPISRFRSGFTTALKEQRKHCKSFDRFYEIVNRTTQSIALESMYMYQMRMHPCTHTHTPMHTHTHTQAPPLPRTHYKACPTCIPSHVADKIQLTGRRHARDLIQTCLQVDWTYSAHARTTENGKRGPCVRRSRPERLDTWDETSEG